MRRGVGEGVGRGGLGRGWGGGGWSKKLVHLWVYMWKVDRTCTDFFARKLCLCEKLQDLATSKSEIKAANFLPWLSRLSTS